MTDTDSYTQAELVRAVRSLQAAVDSLRVEIRADITRLEQNYVNRSEWDTWKTGNDREMKSHADAIAEVKAAATPVRVSGWMIAGFAVSAIVGAGSLITLVLVLSDKLP